MRSPNRTGAICGHYLDAAVQSPSEIKLPPCCDNVQTDFSGIVYHANYLRFMERGRTNHLRLLGAGHRSLFEEAQQEAPGFAFVVRSMQVEFLKPARMDDVLEVTTAPEEVKGASITLHQRIARGENLLVEAHVRVAFVCGGRARPIPKALRVAMRAGQGLIGS